MGMIDSLFDAGKDYINNDYVTDEEALRRLDICQSCDLYWEITSQCSKCGCIMPVKTKLTHSKCPDNPPKW